MGWAKYAEDINEIVLERMERADWAKQSTATIPHSDEPAALTAIAENGDRKLLCRGCLTWFTFTAGEQAFYKKKGFRPPKRCKCCRDAHSDRIALRMAFSERPANKSQAPK